MLFSLAHKHKHKHMKNNHVRSSCAYDYAYAYALMLMLLRKWEQHKTNKWARSSYVSASAYAYVAGVLACYAYMLCLCASENQPLEIDSSLKGMLRSGLTVGGEELIQVSRHYFDWSAYHSAVARGGPCPPVFFSWKVKTDLYKMFKLKYHQATVWEVFKKWPANEVYVCLKGNSDSLTTTKKGKTFTGFRIQR